MPSRDGTLLVLVVDDEQIVADTLSLILNQSGFDTRAFYSGETALQIARLLRPDVLVTDVVMNGMSGIELAIQVKAELPDCKIILHSGQAVTGNLHQAAEKDGHHFELLSKPVHPQVLINRLSLLVCRG